MQIRKDASSSWTDRRFLVIVATEQIWAERTKSAQNRTNLRNFFKGKVAKKKLSAPYVEFVAWRNVASFARNLPRPIFAPVSAFCSVDGVTL